MKPLEREINRIEKSITNIESEITSNNEALIEASRTGDGERIRSLSKENHGKKSEAETLFSRLEELSGDYEGKSERFQERLKEIKELHEDGS